MKPLTILSLVWFALLCGLFVFATPLQEALFILYRPLHWGALLPGIGILVWGIAAVRRSGRMVCVPAMVAVAGIGLFFTKGFDFGRLVLFQLRKSRYESLLSEAVRTGKVPPEEGDVDDGPPVRYAFFWLRGVTDNWAGVVHDPTGAVMQANSFRFGQANPDPAVGLFGGTLYHCEHLEGSWYLCWFT